MPPKIPTFPTHIKIAAMVTAAAVAVAVCWVAWCAKKTGREAALETHDTLTVISDTLSEIPNTFTDTRDGKTYKTVNIGKQTWMAENLNYATESGSSCYGDKPSNCNKYGRLYQWNTAMSACPSGWHLPSNEEWGQLVTMAGGFPTAGTTLKSKSGWKRNGWKNKGKGTDDFGFSALPGGNRYANSYSHPLDDFVSGGYTGNWWTATELELDGSNYNYVAVHAYSLEMYYHLEYVGKHVTAGHYGYSVRCVDDRSAIVALPQKSVGDDKVGIEIVFVKGGTFMMGCTSEQGSDCYGWEKPAHSVTVSDFYIGKYEVTHNQWIKVMEWGKVWGGNKSPSYFKGDNLPAEQVSWNDVQKFILRLNAMTGKQYRLPTEAEWEYAARGGANSKGYKYSGSNSGSDVAWYNVNSGDMVLRDGLFEEYSKKNDFAGYDEVLSSNKNRTRAVGTKAPNELGIYDMSGNVWEWVNDGYGKYNATAQINPSGQTSSSLRVFRGGSWDRGARDCRVSNREVDAPDFRYYGMGFRLALHPESTE